ncbi:putative aconitase with swiveling domain [Arthrobacter stackebrandtii]|uniref:Aconitase with swiveling domain n=1 Tax=Arthrobacter stackebrandtii TaxID=272161 RepID=A0ABS4YVJ8_9MICC|nr:DUF126 domain-containing protein [Arthrobacter stackebrandtii]MBP2412824.1 putative aconitase with swiveling domain [Arthrobacter stackebrandtii]
MTSSGPEAEIAAATEPAAAFGGMTLCAGSGSGPLLALAEPLSFWGGTDRNTGEIIDAHHPQRGRLLGGQVLVMDASRGSSSSSSVLAEQLRAGVGPAAILLTARDAIVCLGVLAAAELYGGGIPVVLLDHSDADRLHQSALPASVSVTAEPGGRAAVVLSTGAGAPEPQP